MTLSTIFASLTKGFLKNLLKGAGLTLGSATLSLAAFNVALSHFKAQLNSVSGDILGMASLAGFDICFSLILGAIVTRLTTSESKLFLKKMRH